MRLPAHVVCETISFVTSTPRWTLLTVFCRNLDKLPHPRDCSRFAWILVSDDSFTDTLCLSERRTKVLEMKKSEDAAGELEAQVRGIAACSCGGNVVEQAGQGPCFEKGGFVSLDPGREMLGHDDMACQCISWDLLEELYTLP